MVLNTDEYQSTDVNFMVDHFVATAEKLAVPFNKIRFLLDYKENE
jgi:hypothetical protein